MKSINATAAAVVIGAFLMQPAGAQTLSGQLVSPYSGTYCGDKVQAVGMTLSPSQPLAGQTVTVTFSFKNACTSGSALNIPWAIYIDSTVLGTGTASVAPGQVISASRTFLAQAGAHNIYAGADDSNTLGDSNRSNNIPPSIAITINADWNAVRDKTINAMKQAVPAWQSSAAIKDVVINGAIANGGHIEASSPYSQLYPRMTGSGMPAEVAGPIAAALSDQWQSWSNSFSVPNLPWYPAFGAWPGPTASPTPNVPMPLGSVTLNSTYVSSSNLSSAMRNRLGTLASLSGAGSATDAIGNFVSSCFAQGVIFVQITNVLGSGNVPIYRPPWVMVGPVVDGRGNSGSTPPLIGPMCPCC